MTKKILVWIVLFCWHIIVANLIFLLSLKIAGIKDQAEGDLVQKFFKSLFFGEINGIQFGPFTTLSTIGVLIYSSIKDKIYDSLPPKEYMIGSNSSFCLQYLPYSLDLVLVHYFFML